MNNSNLQSTNHPRPKVKKYSHLLTFLSDYFNYRKEIDVDFTYELWSKELGFKSTAIMYLISKGQRPLTVPSAAKIIDHLKLSESEKKHLLLLAHYQQTKSPEIKSVLFDKILEGLEYPEVQMATQQYAQFITSPTMPLIRMVLAYDDVKGTEKEILSVLNISKLQLKKDLADLEKMGLVKKIQFESTSETIWKSTAKALRFPERAGEDVMELFFIKDLAETATIVNQRDIFKKMRNLILAIDPQDHQILEDEIEQFVSKLKNKFSYNHLNQKHLIKVNFQAYQASHTKKGS